MKRFLRILIYAALCLLAVPMMAAVSLMLDAGPPWLLLILAVIALACWYWSKRAPIDQDQPMRSPPVPPPFPAMTVATRKQPQRPPAAAASRQRPAHYRAERRTSGARRTNDSSRRRQTPNGGQTSHYAHFQPQEEPHQPMHTRIVEEEFDADFHYAGRADRNEFSWSDEPMASRSVYDDDICATRKDPSEDLGKWIRGDPPYDHHRHDNDFKG